MGYIEPRRLKPNVLAAVHPRFERDQYIGARELKTAGHVRVAFKLRLRLTRNYSRDTVRPSRWSREPRLARGQ